MNDAITDRQLALLKALYSKESASRSELEQVLESVSKITVVRELNELISKGLVVRTGQGPSTRYHLSDKAGKLKLYDPTTYLAQEPDQRGAKFTSFNTGLIKTLDGSLSQKDQRQVANAVELFRQKREASFNPKELERFIIELSWKSSKIEGNTYSLLDTEQLIKGSVEAIGHTHEEAVMILNHKKAFDYVWQNRNQYKNLTKLMIEDIHSLLVKDLNIKEGLRDSMVGITGTVYIPPVSKPELESNLASALEIVNNFEDPVEKGLAILIIISYLQPFTDGNKRTARLVSNALLLAHNYPPLSYRSTDEKDYKGSLILFYEQGAYAYIKDLFVEQLLFSAKNYNL